MLDGETSWTSGYFSARLVKPAAFRLAVRKPP
jgi:hypothetical protein